MRILIPTLHDVPGLAALWRPTFALHHELDPTYYVPDSEDLAAHLERYLEELTSGGEKQIRVAVEDDGRPIGLVLFWEDAEAYFDTNLRRFLFVSELFVAAEARGRGVGEALLEACEDYARSRGLQHLKLHVSTSNPRAQSLYERLGYVERQRTLFKPVGAR